MRVLSEEERAHKNNMESLHLPENREELMDQSLQEYAAYNFISLPIVSFFFNSLEYRSKKPIIRSGISCARVKSLIFTEIV